LNLKNVSTRFAGDLVRHKFPVGQGSFPRFLFLRGRSAVIRRPRIWFFGGGGARNTFIDSNVTDELQGQLARQLAALC